MSELHTSELNWQFSYIVIEWHYVQASPPNSYCKASPKNKKNNNEENTFFVIYTLS